MTRPLSYLTCIVPKFVSNTTVGTSKPEECSAQRVACTNVSRSRCGEKHTYPCCNVQWGVTSLLINLVDVESLAHNQYLLAMIRRDKP